MKTFEGSQNLEGLGFPSPFEALGKAKVEFFRTMPHDAQHYETRIDGTDVIVELSWGKNGDGSNNHTTHVLTKPNSSARIHSSHLTKPNSNAGAHGLVPHVTTTRGDT